MATVDSTAPTLGDTFTGLLGMWGSKAIESKYTAPIGTSDLTSTQTGSAITRNNADTSGGFSLSTGLMIGGAVVAIVALVLILRK